MFFIVYKVYISGATIQKLLIKSSIHQVSAKRHTFMWTRCGMCNVFIASENKNAKVNWQFTTEGARIKLSRLYPTLED